MKKNKPQPRTVVDHLDVISPYSFEGDLLSVIKTLNDFVARYGEKAYIDWDPYNHYRYDHDPSPIYNIYRKRDETDEEMNKRLDEEKVRKEFKLEEERKQYEALKEKFKDV